MLDPFADYTPFAPAVELAAPEPKAVDEFSREMEEAHRMASGPSVVRWPTGKRRDQRDPFADYVDDETGEVLT